MSNAIFPALPGLQFNNTKTPSWNVIEQASPSGMEQRGQFYTVPIWTWALSFEFLRADRGFTEYQTLVDFFNSRGGSYDNFLYTDPSDSVIPDVNPYMKFGTGDGVTVAFQMGRSFVTGGFFEPLYNPGPTTPKIYVNGVLKTLGSDYTINSGLVTFSSAPAAAAPVAWSGSYYWRVRFAQKATQFKEFANNFWEANKIELISIKGL